jgi:nucleoside-diphosphate-sugar epimerase
MTILVTGANGQIGSALTVKLRGKYGEQSVVASDIERPEAEPRGPFETVDVTNPDRIEAVIDEYDVETVYHLAAILSAVGEQNPQLAYEVNINGLYNVLEACRTGGVEMLMVPSSIAAFGPSTPNDPAEKTVLFPRTIYGISKVFGELLGNYYYDTYGLDVRGMRFPGVLSHEEKPGGGTTDYAVEAFYGAIQRGEYTYFVRPETRLPMMYMPDTVNAMIGLAEADGSCLGPRTSYHVGALSFSAAELTAEIQKHRPAFEASYEPDERQAIADTWPDTVDDSAAREDWDWEPEYGFEAMVADMLNKLGEKLDSAT